MQKTSKNFIWGYIYALYFWLSKLTLVSCKREKKIHLMHKLSKERGRYSFSENGCNNLLQHHLDNAWKISLLIKALLESQRGKI